MESESIACLLSIKRCGKQLLSPIFPTVKSLWEANASFLSICKTNVIDYVSRIPPYNSKTCLPYSSLDKSGKECSVPTLFLSQE